MSDEPVAWIRYCDGSYEGPIMHNLMEDVRKKSGAWTPLFERDAEIARLREDAARLNWLERDESYIDTEGKCHHALFRRNLPITRAAIDVARKEKTSSKFSEFIPNAAQNAAPVVSSQDSGKAQAAGGSTPQSDEVTAGAAYILSEQAWATVALRDAEIARLREDAERYRWLRSQTKISDSRFYDMPKEISSLNFSPGTGRDYNSRFDSCIDNTRKEKT